MSKMFKDAVAYTAQTLAKYHGMDERHWDYVIRHHLPEMGLPFFCISRDPKSSRKRVAAWGRDLNAWDERCQKAARESEAAVKPHEKRSRPASMQILAGQNPDGTIMNSRQLKAAGLWKGA